MFVSLDKRRVAAVAGPVVVLGLLASATAATSSALAAPSGRTGAAVNPLVRAERVIFAPISTCTVSPRGVATRASCVSDAVRTVAAPATVPTSVAISPDASVCKRGFLVTVRHASCGDFNLKFKIVELPSGKVVGTGTVNVKYDETLSAKSRTWSMTIAMELLSATGEARSGMLAPASIKCTGGCNAPGSPVLPLPLHEVASVPIQISSPGTATDFTHQTPKIFLRHAGASDTRDLPLPGMGPARCDSIAVKGSRGCVFSDLAAVYVLHLHGHGVNSVASHVKTAQRTKPGHFGWFGHGKALTRATSASIARKNRRVACRNKHFAPDTCDEYPFAATFQGASFFPHSNSTFPVPGDQNSREGALRVAMYRSERLLNKDPYFVFIVN
jgi:hypothetical protein